MGTPLLKLLTSLVCGISASSTDEMCAPCFHAGISYKFKVQSFRVRVSNPRTTARLLFGMAFSKLEAPESGSIEARVWTDRLFQLERSNIGRSPSPCPPPRTASFPTRKFATFFPQPLLKFFRCLRGELSQIEGTPQKFSPWMFFYTEKSWYIYIYIYIYIQ